MPPIADAIEIRAIGPLDTDALIQWNRTLGQGYIVGRTAAYWASPETTIATYQDPKPGRTSVQLVALCDGVPVGAAGIDCDEGEPADVEISVLPEHRRQGIGRLLAEAVRARLRTMGAEIVQTETYRPAGVAFAESLGMSAGIREHRLLLDLPVDPPLPPASPVMPGVELRTWSGSCPDDVVEDWALLETQMNEDVPMGTLTRRQAQVSVDRVRRNEQRMDQQGWTLLRSLVRVDGVPAGYTEIFVSRHDRALVTQDDTLVDRAHRGRGLGRMLKLANLRALAELPEAAEARWVQTYTAVDNAAMLALNRSLGFREADLLTILEGPVIPEGPVAED